VTISARALREFAIRALRGAGADASNARIVAQHLVMANLTGVDTHGVAVLPGYVDAIRAGYLRARAKPIVDAETPVAVRVRGQWGFGHVATHLATEIGVAKATAGGCAVVAIVECGHVGRLGHYVERAARAGVAGMLFAGGYGVAGPLAAAYGGIDAVLSTNPLAFAFPDGGPLFDFATTAVSGGRVVAARRRGERLPPGVLIASDGSATDDPAQLWSGGALLPFGEHKGYALMIATEWLGRIATGADDFAPDSPVEASRRHQGLLGVFIRADLFVSRSASRERTRDTAERIRATRSQPGRPPVRVPGDQARAIRSSRTRHGIPIEPAVWTSLVALGDTLGVKLDPGRS
jgi:uncharacterized oxidoreductase